MLACGIYSKIYNSPVVKASNIEFSFLLLFGISGLHILAVLNVPQHSNLLCLHQLSGVILPSISLVLVLFTKTMRITTVRIKTHGRRRKTALSSRGVETKN